MASGPLWLVSGFRFRARLSFSIPFTFSGPRGITPAFGYGAPHPSARGTLTLLSNALLSAHYGPLRHPRRPGLALTSCRLTAARSPLGLPVLHLVPFVCMPSPIPRQDRWARSLVLSHRHRPSLDSPRVGSCITLFEACTAFTLVTACKLAKSPIATLYTEGFSSFVASTTAPIATGWSEPVPGRDLHPLLTSAFSRRTTNLG